MSKKYKLNTININKSGTSSTVLALCPIGAANEDDYTKGVSHFLEHMCFKGTKKRNVYEISGSIEKLGGDLNAFTDNELTCYWATVSNKHLSVAQDVILDLVTNCTLPEKEVNKKRQVIIQELKMYEDNPAAYAHERFNKEIFDKKSSLYLPTVGTLQSLKNTIKRDLVDYHKKHYDPITLITVGKVKDKEDIIMPIDNNYYDNTIKEEKMVSTLITRPGVTQANIIIGNAIKLEDFSYKEIYYNLRVLHSVYNDMSGRLFSKVREQHNLCYRVKFDYEVLKEKLVIWQVTIGLEKSKINKAKRLIVKELNREILNKEVRDNIIKTIGITNLALDNPHHIAEMVAYKVNQGLDWKEYVKDYEKKTKRYTLKLRDFAKALNFKNYITVGVIPNEK